MTLIQIENNILEQIRPVQNFNCVVQSLNDGLYAPARSTTVYLSYKDRECQMLTFNSVSKEILRFEIILKVNDLRSHTRAYPILESLKKLLKDFDPLPGETIQSLSFQLEIFRDDLLPEFWVYQQLWKLELAS